jgi:hypothetical protein
MRTNHHPNPITQHNRNVSAQLPVGARSQPAKGAYGVRRDSRRLKGFHEPNRSPTRPVVEYVGINLVKWYLAQDMKEEARELLAEIKSGTVNPRTGERNVPSRK